MNVSIEVVGPLAVLDQNGSNLTPRGLKARGLVALLALSDGPRAREWLQAVLWPDRSRDQARVSLRQTLAEIRKSLGECRQCLVADRRTVTFDLHLVTCQTKQQIVNLLQGSSPRPVMLEDLGGLRGEFAHWLEEQRKIHSETGILYSESNPVFSEGRVPRLAVVASGLPSDSTGQLFGQYLADAVAHSLTERSGVEVASVKSDDVVLALTVSVVSDVSSVVVYLSLEFCPTATRCWSHTTNLEVIAGSTFTSGKIRSLINMAVDVTQHQFLIRSTGSSLDDDPRVGGLRAINQMFQLTSESLVRAVGLFDSAWVEHKSAVFMAWKAYCYTYFIGERISCDQESLVEEARYLVEKAILLEPYNSQILALASYVYCFLLNRTTIGHELAVRSHNINPTNPFAVSALSQAHFFVGDYESAYQSSLIACNLAGVGPYRFMLDSQCGMAATLTNRYEHAIRMSSIARAEKPNYAPPIRYRFALNLAIGQYEEANKSWDALKAIEPDISLRLMRDEEYPCRGIRLAGLLDERHADYE